MLKFLSINCLTPTKNIRPIDNDASFKQLCDSIKANGLLQPILVREVDENSYEMVTAFVGAHMRDAYGDFYDNPPVAVFGNCDVGVLYDAGTRDGFIAWANYVVFKPVQ